MAIGKCNQANPILYGSSAIFAPNPQTFLYSPTDRVITVGGTGIGFFEELAGRFLADDWVPGGSLPVGSGDTNSATGADAVVYYEKPGKGRHVALQGVAWSYGGSPTGGSIAVESPSGVPVFGPLKITAAGPGSAPFEMGLKCPANKDVLVRLTSGGGSVAGTVSVEGKRVE